MIDNEHTDQCGCLKNWQWLDETPGTSNAKHRHCLRCLVLAVDSKVQGRFQENFAFRGIIETAQR